MGGSDVALLDAHADPLDEEDRIAEEMAETDLVIALCDRPVGIHGDLQGLAGESVLLGADPGGRLGKTGLAAGGRSAKARMGHGRESSVGSAVPPRPKGCGAERGYDDEVTDRPTMTTGEPSTEPGTGSQAPIPPPSTATPTPAAQAPGERRLAHPPSDRYRAAEAAAAERDVPDPAASVARGVALATVAAIAGAALTVVLGGVITLTAGLVGVAIATGWAVAAGLRFGAGSHLVGSRRAWIAVAIALVAVALGQLGLWLYARTEGGVLPLPEYLGEVFGILVPIQAVFAALTAWVSAR
jgi:hypothetical protein